MKSAIQQSYGAIDKTGKLSRPNSGSIVTRPNAWDWEADGSTGFSYKYLFEDVQTGQKTVLMQMAAGSVASPHAHDTLEQILVLEGDFYDEYRTYGPGDFVIRAPGAVHTGGTTNGALVLLVYSE